MKSHIQAQLEQNKSFDAIKAALAKDPNLAKVDRSQIIDRLRKEGVLEDIINGLQLPKGTPTPQIGGPGSLVKARDVEASDSYG